ncbi:MAG: hypothetical protein V3571_05855 [Pseudodesulfovibrio sp.]
MANGIRDDNHKALLEELLRDVENPEERERLRKAWEATACLRKAAPQAPPLSPQLQTALGKMDEALSDDDLDMLAAAGTPFKGPNDQGMF